jgi:hypothetical protein
MLWIGTTSSQPRCSLGRRLKPLRWRGGWETLDDRKNLTPQELNDTLMRMLGGTKLSKDAPQPFNILTLIDRMDKRVSGTRHGYDLLSEIAHPNWSGVFAMYGKMDQSRFTAQFGRGLRLENHLKDELIVLALLNALSLFEYAYNRISAEMRDFVAGLEKLPSPTDEPPGS